MMAGADQVNVSISISNDETEKSPEKHENQDSSQPEIRTTEHIDVNSSHIELSNKNSPGNESASTIRANSTSPEKPLMSSPTRPDDDDDGEIFKLRKVQWALNFCILGCLVASRIVEKLESTMVWGLQLWKWCVCGMAIFWGKLLVNWTIHFIVVLMKWNFKEKKKALYFVVGLRKSVQVFTRMLLVLAVWKYLLDDRTEQSKTATRIFKYVTRTIISTLIGSFLFLLKRLWLLVLAYDFRVNGINDKITKEDLLRFMIEEVCRAFPMIERHESGQIDIKSLTDFVIKVYHRRNLPSRSIADIEKIVEQVNSIANWILVLVVIILWIILMEFIKLDVVVLLLTAAAFMLGNPCKSLFDAIIFVFIVHPFDVGDRCVVDDIELFVEEINMLTTAFSKPNNEKVLYPNSVLATKPISKYYSSPDMEFSIDYGAPKEKIEEMKEKIKQYLKKSPHHWHLQHSFVVKDVEDSNKINMILYCRHSINLEEFGEKNKRRAELLDEIMMLFEELNIKFYNIRCSDKFVAGLPSQQ